MLWRPVGGKAAVTRMARGDAADLRGVYAFRDKCQAFFRRDGVRVYVGVFRSKAAAAAAIRARRQHA